MAKLSKREKILIYIMIVVIVVAGGVFLLVRPAYEAYSEARNQLSEVEMQREMMEMDIASIPRMRKDIQEYTTKINDLKSEFLSYMSNEEIDAMITGFIAKSGLTPEELEISVISASDVTAFGEGGDTADNENSGQDAVAADESEDAEDAIDAADPESADVIQGSGETSDAAVGADAGSASADVNMSVREVTVQARGNLAQFVTLIGYAAKQTGVRTTGFQVTQQAENTDVLSLMTSSGYSAASGSNSSFTAQVTFQVYMSL